MTSLLIAGATGLVGGQALALALEDARVDRVVALTRRPLSAHPKLHIPIVDFGRLPTDAAWSAVEGAVCALGTTRAKAGSVEAFRSVDHDYPLVIARLVRENGGTSFGLVSSMGADAGSRFLYTRTKGQVEEAVRRLQFPSLTIVRPGLLGGDRDDFRATEYVAQVLFRVAAPLLPRRFRISPAAEVARILVEAAIAGQAGERLVESAQLTFGAPSQHPA